MGIISVSSFVGGLAESSVMVIVALTADSLVRGSQSILLLGRRLTLTEGVGLALIFVLIRAVTTLSGAFVAARLASLVMLNAQRQVAEAYLSSSYAVRSSRDVGDLPTVMVNHGRFTGDLATSFTSLASAGCSLLAFGGTSLVVNPVATLGISTVGVVVLASLRPLRQRNKIAAAANAEVSRDIGADVGQLEVLHREIAVFNVGERVLSTLDKRFRAGAVRLERARFLSASIPQIFQTALLGAAVLSLLAIVNIVSEGANVAAIGAVVLLLLRSMSSTQLVVTANQQIVERAAFGREVNELVVLLRSEKRVFGAVNPPSLLPVALNDVEFSYDTKSYAVKGMSTQISAGEVVGIVGPSGAGKSTFVELLLRLRRPTAGTITCAKVPVDDISPDEFGRRVAFVPQKAVLIKGTVAENVDFFRGLPPERISAAIAGANLANEIDALPEGMDTRLGPDSRSLSGGQQQRLTIARALAGDPDILILDEPTSALDAVSEEAIRRTLDELPEDRVVIIVAHRYSTLSSCSRILVIEQGVLQIDASPSEVAEHSEFFRAMVGEGV